MPLPYQVVEAVQNPAIAFRAGSWLHAATVERDRLGLPRPRAGNFAVTFQMQRDGERRALRCFTRHPADMRERYDAIQNFLNGYRGSLLVPSEYQHAGMLVNGSWEPITLMPWVDGVLITDYVTQHLTSSDDLSRLADRLLDAHQELETLGVAHGDWQHGNIIVRTDGRIRLVDYDGMFVPRLHGRKASEIGHRNYQHPKRSDRHFGPSMDRFSVLCMVVALRALAVEPTLWKQFEFSEALLFRKEDFVQPRQSKLFAALRSVRAVRESSDAIVAVLEEDPAELPLVRGLLDGSVNIRKPTQMRTQVPLPEPAPFRWEPTLDAADPDLWKLAGIYVTVVGKPFELDINETAARCLVFRAPTTTGWTPSMRMVLPREVDRGFAKLGRPAPGLSTWVRVSGIVQSFGGAARLTVERPSDVMVVSPSEASAMLGLKRTVSQWLAGADEPGPAAPRVASRSTDSTASSSQASLEAALDRMYGTKPVGVSGSAKRPTGALSPSASGAATSSNRSSPPIPAPGSTTRAAARSPRAKSAVTPTQGTPPAPPVSPPSINGGTTAQPQSTGSQTQGTTPANPAATPSDPVAQGGTPVQLTLTGWLRSLAGSITGRGDRRP